VGDAPGLGEADAVGEAPGEADAVGDGASPPQLPSKRAIVPIKAIAAGLFITPFPIAPQHFSCEIIPIPTQIASKSTLNPIIPYKIGNCKTAVIPVSVKILNKISHQISLI